VDGLIGWPTAISLIRSAERPSSGDENEEGSADIFVRSKREMDLWKTRELWKKKFFREGNSDDRGRTPVRKTFASLTAPRAAKRITESPCN
jgi:hypothetical protein